MRGRITRYLVFLSRCIGWLLGWNMLNILYFCMPSSYRAMGLTLGKYCGANFVHKNPTDYIYSFRTFKALIGRLHWFVSHISSSAFLTYPAPNTKIHYKDSEHRILDFQSEDRPLVVIFGSLTSTMFMAHLHGLLSLIGDFRNTTDFMFVYCQEAHAVDAWSFKNPQFPIATHRSLNDRVAAAQTLEQQLQNASCRVVVDSMDNDSCSQYGALPCRLYVLNNGRIAMAGGAGPDGYNIGEVATWLQDHQC